MKIGAGKVVLSYGRYGISLYVCSVKPYDFFFFFQIKNVSVQSVYCNLFPDFFQADFMALLDSQVRDEIKTF